MHTNLNLVEWRIALERAKEIYWKARSEGADENKALYAVLDAALRGEKISASEFSRHAHTR